MTRRTANSALAVAVSVFFGATSCADSPKGPQVHLVVAAAPGGGPKVQRTDPATGEQSQRLFVRVIGSGFDVGSNARWLLSGAPINDVVTNATTFVNSRELLADISISGGATLGLYDIEVATSRGKKGVGIELFEVLEPQRVSEVYTTFHRSSDPIHGDGRGAYETVKRRQAVESAIGASGQFGLRIEAFSSRSVCVSFPPDGPDLDVLSLDDWQDLQAASGGAIAPGREYCGPVTMHTRDHLEPDKLRGMDADPASPEPDDIQTSGGKLVLKEFDDAVSWEWRMLFDDSHTAVNGGKDSNGLCIRFTPARTWMIGTDPSIEDHAETPENGVCTEVDEWINLIRWLDDGSTVHVARMRMPFRFTVTPR